MDAQTRYPQRVPRHPWTPDARQAKLLAMLRRAARQRAALDARYREILAECAAAEIPVKAMADEVGVERKTVYRHLGRSMT